MNRKAFISSIWTPVIFIDLSRPKPEHETHHSTFRPLEPGLPDSRPIRYADRRTPGQPVQPSEHYYPAERIPRSGPISHPKPFHLTIHPPRQHKPLHPF